MSKYKLEEFKQWLKKTDEGKRWKTIELQWSNFFPNGVYNEEEVEKTKKDMEEKKHKYSPYFPNSLGMLIEWKNEVDQRERERDKIIQKIIW